MELFLSSPRSASESSKMSSSMRGPLQLLLLSSIILNISGVGLSRDGCRSPGPFGQHVWRGLRCCRQLGSLPEVGILEDETGERLRHVLLGGRWRAEVEVSQHLFWPNPTAQLPRPASSYSAVQQFSFALLPAQYRLECHSGLTISSSYVQYRRKNGLS